MLRYFTDIPNAPKALGPYSPAVGSDNIIFLSGQIPIDPATGKLVSGGIEEQTEQVMKNISAVFAHLKIDFSNIAKTNIFLVDLGHFQAVNAIYGKWVGDTKPARSTVQVAALPLGSLVEIEMTAVLG